MRKVHLLVSCVQELINTGAAVHKDHKPRADSFHLSTAIYLENADREVDNTWLFSPVSQCFGFLCRPENSQPSKTQW